MRRMREPLAVKLWGTICVGGAVVISCLNPTYVELRVTTNLRCADVRGVRIVVGKDQPEVTRHVIQNDVTIPVIEGEGRCGPDFGTISLTPGDGAGEGAVLVALRYGAVGAGDALDCQPPAYKDCVVARRTFRYTPQTKLSLPIVLDANCVGVPCDEKTTCVNAQCKKLSELECLGGRCDIRPDAATVSSDGGTLPSDGGTSASDASCEVTNGTRAANAVETCEGKNGASLKCTGRVCIQAGPLLVPACVPSLDEVVANISPNLAGNVFFCSDVADCECSARCLGRPLAGATNVTVFECQKKNGDVVLPELCHKSGNCPAGYQCEAIASEGFRRCKKLP